MRLVPIHQLPRLVQREDLVDLYREIQRLEGRLAERERRIAEQDEELRNVRRSAARAIEEPGGDLLEAVRDIVTNGRRWNG